MTGNLTANAAAFGALHVPGDPLVLFNIWDAGSARAVAAAGAKALATGSYGVAGALGKADGEDLALTDALANLARIAGVTDLPVSIDLEAGYAAEPAGVARHVAAARDAGACGINIEDRLPGTSALLPVARHAERLAAAASAGIWINARCDVFRPGAADGDMAAKAAEVLHRASAYAEAGADSLFVPFLADPDAIGAICRGSPIPVNILIDPQGPSHAELARLGVARISHGHQPWAAAMAFVEREARAALA